MPHLTVVGVGGSQVDVTIQTSQNASIAAQILGVITNQVTEGNLTPYAYGGIGPLDAPTSPGYLIVTGPGAASLPASTSAVVDVAHGPVLLMGGDAPSQVVVSESPLTYLANTGVGTVVASGGGSTLVTPLVGGGNHLFLTDGEHNRILAFSGDDTIGAGPGHNSIVLGSGNDLVLVTGHDSIVAGSGNDTVDVLSGDAIVQGGTGTLIFANGSGASTVFGGAGSDTILGGNGGGVYHGGAAGNNLLIGGLAATTLFGGGNNDMLVGESSVRDVLIAGPGNETLIGAGNGNDTFVGGSGADSMMGGFGRNTFIAGSGGGTMTGGIAGNIYEFIDDRSQGSFVITDFTPGVDKIKLVGDDKDDHKAIEQALKSQVSAGGNVTITLEDNTKVTFLNVSHLDRSSFMK
jgi:serralysin